jgi:hypothetical protein
MSRALCVLALLALITAALQIEGALQANGVLGVSCSLCHD